MTSMLITDRLQNTYDYSAYTIIRDVIIILTIYLSYTYLPFDTFSSIWKLYLGVLVVRFVLSELTLLRDEETKKKYFQMSGHIALFTLSVLFASTHNIFNLQNIIFRNGLLLAYAILNIIVHAHYTTDVVNTLVFIHFLYLQYTLK